MEVCLPDGDADGSKCCRIGAEAAGIRTHFVSADLAKTTMEVLPANEKWFVGAGAGVHFFVGESDRKALFGDRVSPGGELNVGKWITPALAVRMQLEGVHMTGAYKDETRESWNFLHAHVDAMVDVISLWKGVLQSVRSAV